MTVATMLMKYGESDQDMDNAPPDLFESELREMGKKIFGQQTAIVDFIISQESVKVDPKAHIHMKKEKTFVQKFF